MGVGPGKVVVLAGGTGGAKLARGMLDVVGAEDLAVIANTGDDVEVYGARVSPDPDLITFWLADQIDERGWGLRGDTFTVMDELRRLGRDVWFNLGDRDLAWCLERRRLEDEGATPTEALRRLAGRIGVHAEVLPMTDSHFPTFVNDLPLQEFLIRAGGRGPIRSVSLGGTGLARHADPAAGGAPAVTAPGPTAAVLAALAAARAIIVGPSNPVISIGPIVAVIGEALSQASAPIVAVSPVVGGEVLKGPTDAFMEALRLPTTAAGVAAHYQRFGPWRLAGMVADEPLHGAPGANAPAAEAVRTGSGMPSAGPELEDLAWLECDTLMADADGRARVARAVLAFAESLAR